MYECIYACIINIKFLMCVCLKKESKYIPVKNSIFSNLM